MIGYMRDTLLSRSTRQEEGLMQHLSGILGLIAALGMTIGVAAPASAADPPGVVQFISVGAGAGGDAVLAEAKKTKMIFQRLGIKATRRFIRATLAGDFSGTLSLMIEYPNLGALADGQAKLANDSEWQEYLEKIRSEGMRVQSNSVWIDVTP